MTEEWHVQSEEERQAYDVAFEKLWSTWVELSEVVGPVKASDFLRWWLPIPEGKNPGGRKRKDTSERASYNATRGKKKRVAAEMGVSPDTMQRRNREEREKEADGNAVLLAMKRLRFLFTVELHRRGYTPEQMEAEWKKACSIWTRERWEEMAERSRINNSITPIDAAFLKAARAGWPIREG